MSPVSSLINCVKQVLKWPCFYFTDVRCIKGVKFRWITWQSWHIALPIHQLLTYKTLGIELYFLFQLWVEFATISSLMGSSWLIARTYFYRGRARVEKIGKKKKMAQFELGKVCIVLHPYLYPLVILLLACISLVSKRLFLLEARGRNS